MHNWSWGESLEFENVEQLIKAEKWVKSEGSNVQIHDTYGRISARLAHDTNYVESQED